ncbi:hypothetical protein H5394_06630 [Paracoccus sp. MC1862]|nr:hypothetical protein [Paracoccus sp. MC1854]MBB1497822.1 hypothetical protein [Paracoccus sp. MC1862]QQO46287.1 hypothetical protein JGR78_02660 [Paracoccus sp. MC1862]
MAACLMLAGCGDSSLNPMRWFGGERAPRAAQTLAPEGGYDTRNDDRLPMGQVLSARWEQTLEGRLLVVTAMPPTKGWWNVELVTETPRPADRVLPDPDGVLRLRLVGAPPPADSTAARMPAQPGSDTLTIALPLSSPVLSRMHSVVVAGAANAISLGV